MKQLTTPVFTLFSYAAAFGGLLLPLMGMAQSPVQSPVFPNPASVTLAKGTYSLSDTIRYDIGEEDREVIQSVVANFRKFHRLVFVEDKVHPDLKGIRGSLQGPEGYALSITGNGILIQFDDKNGLLYGLQTLDQWMQKQQGKIAVPYVDIKDKPRFGYRGVHLDCSRHFYTMDELKSFIDQAAALKLNRFHWHLTDDQGWRLEIKQFPELTKVGAWRDSTIVGHYSRSPRSYDKTRHGGFYTQEEAKEIVRYAAARGMIVVPEIELPGHARAALAAYPQLGCTGEELPVPGVWGVFDDVFCTKPETLDFLKRVLDEVVAIFPSETIHIGGDECPKVRWDVCPRCQQVRKDHDLKDSHELQSYVIREMEAHLAKHRRKLIGWDEILEGGLADNAQVMSWRGTEGGIAAARQLHQVVMTPTTYCYFDYYQSGHPDEPLAIGGYLPLEKVYSFDPIPAELEKQYHRYIIGGQANLWTEYLPAMSSVEYNAYPRLIAMAQVLWCNEKPKYEDFVSGMMEHYLWRLDQSKINYSRSFLDPSFVPVQSEIGLAYKVEFPMEGISLIWDQGPITEFHLWPTKLPQTFEMKMEAYAGTQHIRTITQQYTTHRFIGKPVQFTTPPHPKYSHHGNLGLTDGVVGKRPWKGDQWLGFLNDTVQFTIDLGKKEKFELIELGCLDEPGSWIYRPKYIVVETSNDGKTFGKAQRVEITSEQIAVDRPRKARYVRITLLNDEFIPAGNDGAGTTPWTFIDELIIH